MDNKIERKLFLGFVQLHILHHAMKEPVFGLWMKEELEEHGYDISVGTLYPILHNLEKSGLLSSEKIIVEGKIRKYYRTTTKGKEVLESGKKKAIELIEEIK